MKKNINESIKICLIIPYYGKWPIYFDLFINSCKYNPIIDILFITDLELHDKTPKNIHKVHLSYNNLIELFKNKLQQNVNLTSFYKLCDLKPTYGLVFSEYISNYKFWAFGDMDLIFGQLNDFITKDLLNSYDVITFREEWISGSFTIFKNNDYINSLFKLSQDWKKVVTSKNHFSFTEVGGLYNETKKINNLSKLKTEVYTFTQLCDKLSIHGNIKFYRKTLIREGLKKDEYIIYNKGKIYNNKNCQFLLYHFIGLKKNKIFIINKWKNIPDKFYIFKTGIYKYNNIALRTFIRFKMIIYTIIIKLNK